MIILVLLTVPALALLFLQNQQVQTKLSQYIAETISKNTEASISLSSINFSFFKRLQVRDLYISDNHGDTLLYSELTKVRLKQFNRDRRRVHFRSISLENAYINFVVDSSGILNLTMITDRLKNPHLPPENKTRIIINEIELDDSRFGLGRMIVNPKEVGINFTDLDLDIEKVRVEDLIFYMDTVKMHIDKISAREKSGFKLNDLKSDLQICKDNLQFSNTTIETPESECIMPLIDFRFDSYDQFDNFTSGVNMDIIAENADLAGPDLAYFVPSLRNYRENIKLTGRISGKVEDLTGSELNLIYANHNNLRFNFTLIGLPDIKNTFLDIDFEKFTSNTADLNNILIASKIHGLDELGILQKFGSIEYKGKFTGYPDNFVTTGFLGTDLGNMVLDLSFKPDSLKNIGFRGKFRCNDLLLGSMIEQDSIVGKLDMSIYTDGIIYKNDLFARMNGNIDTIEFFDYAYSNIDLDGIFQNRKFDGRFSISDPNIMMDFEGLMDFSSEVPRYNFVADVSRARPYYLKLRNDDPGYFTSFLVETDLSGRNLDELNGEMRLINSLFEKTGSILQLYNLNLSVVNTPDTSILLLNSDLIDAEIYGNYKLTSLPASFSKMMNNYMNFNNTYGKEFDSINHFSYRIDFKHLNPVLDFFLPTFQVGDGSYLKGKYNLANEIVTGTGKLNYIEVAGNRWNNLDMKIDADKNNFLANTRCDSLTFKSFALENQSFSFLSCNDTSFLNISWKDSISPKYYGQIKLWSTFIFDGEGNRQFFTRNDPSTLIINDEAWELHPSSLLISKFGYSFDSLLIRNGENYILADGTYSKTNGNQLRFSMNNLNLHEINSFLNVPADMSGKVAGDITLKSVNNHPYLLSDLKLDDFTINNELLGNTVLLANWNEESGGIFVDATGRVDNFETFNVSGDYIPESKALNFNIRLNNVNVGAFEPYTVNIAKDFEGTCTAHLTLDGTTEKPELNGAVFFHGASAVINYIETRYTVNDNLRIYRNNFYFEEVNVLDSYNNEATIDGTITTNYFKDLFLNLDINASHLEAINTTSMDNELFYGNVFATGTVKISGPENRIKFDINARTEKNTTFYLPLYNTYEVQTIDFVKFISEDDYNEDFDGLQQKQITGIELDMEIEITPDAAVQLIFDPKVGDIIRTSGKGILQMTLNDKDRFKMFGDIELQGGDYLFTLQNVINKRFQIEPGSRISFSGSPLNANIDLNAIYKLTASPYNLSPESDPDENLKKRIPVECNLNLLGELKNPTIKPGIEMPTADPETRNLLENSTSTEEELMKQFLSLLVINNFYSVTGYNLANAAGVNSSFAGVTASELLSNQLSNWLSQINDDVDIGINYRPGDEVTSDEVEVALSTQLLDDRIRISGNVKGHTTPQSTGTTNPSAIAGDFNVEFRITDNISVKAFNRARDELVFQTAPYKQGVGISYKEDFNTFHDLLMRYKEGLTNRKKKKNKSDKKRNKEALIIPAEEEEVD